MAGQKWLEEIAIQSRDELYAWNNLARESLVVCQENVHARLRGARKVDCVGGSNAKPGPNPGIVVCRVAGERQDLNEWRPESLTNALGHIAHSLLVWPHKGLAHSERTGTKRIFSLLHTREDMPDPSRVDRMLLEPINEEHGVPVNQAHRDSLSRLFPDSRFVEDREDVGRLVVVMIDLQGVRRHYLVECPRFDCRDLFAAMCDDRPLDRRE
jgi:hypothetical protein